MEVNKETQLLYKQVRYIKDFCVVVEIVKKRISTLGVDINLLYF